MSEKYYVVKLSKEVKIDFGGLDYIIAFGYEKIEEDMYRHGHTPILITPSKELAKNTLRALNEQLRKQSY
ncbi:e6 [Lactococcus phage bIL170]|uniref:E6 n=2 Tax=Skunavirus bIL170 TaxID=63118 RepID=O80154_9CAUD|nr:e6 [Lactococcus phage bIL170]AAC27232.1 e6 [Lactococcus phage bIL170]AAR26454.1 e6 protein [Lactococcus phage bIL170]